MIKGSTNIHSTTNPTALHCAPSPILSEYIHSFWHLTCDHSSFLNSERYLPSGHFELIIDLEDAFYQKNGTSDWQLAPRAFVGGMYDQHFFVRASGKVNRLSVVFKPGVIHMFMPAKARELQGVNTHVGDLLGGREDKWLDMLNEAKDDKSATLISLLERFICDLIVDDNRGDAIVSEAIDQIEQSRGQIGIVELSRKLHISERQFRRRFSQKVGLGPKRYAKIVRILRAFSIMKKRPDWAIADIVHDLEYFDRSHFDREFSSVVGISARQSYQEENPLFNKIYFG